jgi:signal transduction histidine kinase
LSAGGHALQQGLINLIDNALKHSTAGGKTVVGLETTPSRDGETAATSTPDAGNESARHLEFWVKDNGEGIPPAEHERIFERFYRLGSELRRQTQGVGIGLSIVKHVVEAHGGRVRVRSDIGQGSRFTVELTLPSSASAHPG